MRKSFALTAGAIGAMALTTALAATVDFDKEAAPNGTHVQQGSQAPDCSVNPTTLTVTCNPYDLGGVGNMNAEIRLGASYEASVDCTNKGGKLVPVKTNSAEITTVPVPAPSDRNGEMRVPAASVSLSTADLLAKAVCPNGNWTKSFTPGTNPTLTSFTYTLTFDDFTSPFITITP